MLFIFLGILIGFLTPIQTALNSKIASSVNSSLIAPFISFIVGLFPAMALTFIIDQSLLFDLSVFNLENIWAWSGTILGVVYLIGIILLFHHLGSVQSAILPILGQIMMGLIIDTLGLFHSTQIPLTLSKIIGALLVTSGVLGTVFFKHKKDTTKHTHTTSWQIFGVILGALVAIQIAQNAQLGYLMHSSIKAGLWAFIIGTIILFIMIIIKRETKEFKTLMQQKLPLHAYLGGIIGCIYIMVSIFITPHIGTGLSVISNLIGVTVGGLIIEHFGLFNSPQHKINVLQIISLIIMLIGACSIQFL